jgi:hypothetical protein
VTTANRVSEKPITCSNMMLTSAENMVREARRVLGWRLDFS